MGTIGIRFACAVGHLHQDKVGRTKRDAVAIYHARRAPARNAPGWCPVIERREERDRRRAEEARRITLGDYITKSYSKWRETNRAISMWKTDRGRLKILVERFGDQYLDVITPKDVEMFRAALLEKGLARTTANRYGDLLVGIPPLRRPSYNRGLGGKSALPVLQRDDQRQHPDGRRQGSRARRRGPDPRRGERHGAVH
jgi:hypothetical protein